MKINQSISWLVIPNQVTRWAIFSVLLTEFWLLDLKWSNYLLGNTNQMIINIQ